MSVFNHITLILHRIIVVKKHFSFYNEHTCVSSQKELGMTRHKYKLKIHVKEKDLLELKLAVDALKVRKFQNGLNFEMKYSFKNK